MKVNALKTRFLARRVVSSFNCGNRRRQYGDAQCRRIGIHQGRRYPHGCGRPLSQPKCGEAPLPIYQRWIKGCRYPHCLPASPDIDTWELYEEPIGTVGSDPVNFIDFRVLADGHSISVQVEQRAYLGNRDVTDIVKSVGLPVNLILVGNTVLDKLGPAEKRILELAGFWPRQ